MNHGRTTTVAKASTLLLAGAILSGCVTSRVENVREGATGIGEGEGVVIMAKSYHLGEAQSEPRPSGSGFHFLRR